MTDLFKPNLKLLSAKVLANINAFYEANYNNHSYSFASSMIGHECNFYLWAKFRWFKKSTKDGRMCRLQERGNLEEFRYHKFLKDIGCQVFAYDENNKQFSTTLLNGHLKMKIDGVVILPESYGFSEPLLFEGKTKATGKAFNQVKAEGPIEQAKDHWNQVCIYAEAYNLNHILYMNTNKNDDDMAVHIEEADRALGKQNINKAERIIFIDSAPGKLSATGKDYRCNMCDLKPQCHGDADGNKAPLDKNCRTCKYSMPTQNTDFPKGWECAFYNNQIIPADFTKVGCDNWESIV